MNAKSQLGQVLQRLATKMRNPWPVKPDERKDIKMRLGILHAAFTWRFELSTSPHRGFPACHNQNDQRAEVQRHHDYKPRPHVTPSAREMTNRAPSILSYSRSVNLTDFHNAYQRDLEKGNFPIFKQRETWQPASPGRKINEFSWTASSCTDERASTGHACPE